MGSGEDTTRLLGRVSLFRELSERELAELAQVAVPRRWLAGEAVFREGDPGDTCYVVKSGSMRVTRRHSDGRQITLAELREGDIFGELAMFGEGETRSATVEAVEESEGVALLAGDLRRTMLSHPEIAVAMLAGLADRIRQVNERLSRQTFQTVDGRVASALLGQVEAIAGDDGAREVLIRATQAQIAQLSGSSRESASRFLAKLERAGVITTGRGKILVHEPSALRNYIY
jgi:CRP/FNR family transcriptional regulator, cyclic AMP receptor protein